MAKVAIVGGGPAGISLAYLISQECPEMKVTIYEKTNRIGGQSESVNLHGTICELGTCCLTLGYTSIKHLINSVNSEYVRATYSINYLDSNNKSNTVQTLTIASLTFAIKYLFYWVWWKICGQDTNPTWKMNRLLFSDWIEQIGLSLTDPGLQIALTKQLYGPTDTVTVHNVFTWLKPSTFITLAGFIVDCVPEGFSSVWDKVASKSNATIKFNTTISDVDALRKKYDYVFVTAPLDTVRTPISKYLTNPFIDAHILSFYINVEKWPNSKSLVYVLNPKLSLQCLSRFPIAEQESYPITNVPIWVLYEVPVGQKISDVNKLLEIAIKEFKSTGDYGRVGKVDVVRFYRYDIQYSPKQLQTRLPQLIESKQGLDNVYYSGGTLSHWDVNSIHNFNVGLVTKFKKHLYDAKYRDYPKTLTNIIRYYYHLFMLCFISWKYRVFTW
jgi:hypothetical protein